MGKTMVNNAWPGEELKEGQVLGGQRGNRKETQLRGKLRRLFWLLWHYSSSIQRELVTYGSEFCQEKNGMTLYQICILLNCICHRIALNWRKARVRSVFQSQKQMVD